MITQTYALYLMETLILNGEKKYTYDLKKLSNDEKKA